MAATLVELEQRVQALETEMTRLRNGKAASQSENPRETEFARQSRENHEARQAAWDKVLAQMGITGEPIGAEKLQELIAKGLRERGINPDDNIFSREIIAMREE